MTVYVDLLFALNMTINYLLLRGSAAMGGCPAHVWRLLLSAALGGLYAVASVLPGWDRIQSGVFPWTCAAMMLFIAFGFRKNTLKQALFFFALSFAFGGAVLLLVQKLEGDCVLVGGRAYYAVSFPAMLLLAGVCYLVAALILKGCGTHTGGDLLPVTLMAQGRSVSLKALRDTGNTLRDPITGQAVMIVDGEKLLSLFPEAALTKQSLSDPAAVLPVLSQLYPKCRFRLIHYRAVGVETGLLLAVRCRSIIGKRKASLLAAFSPSKLTQDETFHALWGGEIT